VVRVDDARLAAALAAAVEAERAIKFVADGDDSPLERASAWTAYRYAVGLRKALGGWVEMRAAKAAQQPVVD
jgi:hypothetical protein